MLEETYAKALKIYLNKWEKTLSIIKNPLPVCALGNLDKEESLVIDIDGRYNYPRLYWHKIEEKGCRRYHVIVLELPHKWTGTIPISIDTFYRAYNEYDNILVDKVTNLERVCLND